MRKISIALGMSVFFVAPFCLPFLADAAEDRTPPQLTSFEIAPTEVNTSNQDQTLTVTMSVTDDLSGVCVFSEPGCSNPLQVNLAPIIGTQYIMFYEDFQRISGNDRNGTYQATAVMPKWSKVGIWTVEFVYLNDRLGNSQELHADDLNRMFPNSNSLIVANTAESSTVTIEKEWEFSSDSTTVTFPGNTVVTRREGGSFAFYQMLNQVTPVENLPSANMTGDSVLAIRLGIPGLDLSFNKNVSVAMNVGNGYNGYELLIQSLGEDANAWANEGSCVVDEGMCSFTVNHASYLSANHVPQSSIITGAGPTGGPHVRAFNARGDVEASPANLFAYAETYRGGVRVATGDIDADGKDEIITGTGENGGPHLRVFEKDGTPRGIEFFPFDPSFRGGMDVASGDFDGDGKDDIAVSQFSKGQAWVKVYRYDTDHTVLFEQNVFGGTECGATVALGDVDEDGRDEIIVGAGNGGGPQIRVYDYDSNSTDGILKPISFFAFDEQSRTGVDVAVGDVDNDGKAEIAVSQLKNGQAWVKVYRYNEAKEVIGEWNAYGAPEVGANVDMANLDHDVSMEIITGAGPGGGPQVRGFAYDGTVITSGFFAYMEYFRGGVDVAGGMF